MDIQALADRVAWLGISEFGEFLACVIVQSSLFECTKDCLYGGPHLFLLGERYCKVVPKKWFVRDDSVLRLHGWIGVSSVYGSREMIHDEA